MKTTTVRLNYIYTTYLNNDTWVEPPSYIQDMFVNTASLLIGEVDELLTYSDIISIVNETK